MPNLSGPPLLARWFALTLAIPSTVNAQLDSARVAGTVRSSVNGLPLAGVMIAIGGARRFHVTDTTGMFALSGLPPGKQVIRVLYRDDVLVEQPFTLKQGRTLQLQVLLDVEAVRLAPIVVQARSVRSRQSLAGFYERRKRGFGRFYTYEDLERRGPLPLRTLLAESGLQTPCRMGGCFVLGTIGGRQCQISLQLDGFPVSVWEVDMIRLDDLAGVEVYRRHGEVPWEFRHGFGGCGSIVMWSRY